MDKIVWILKWWDNEGEFKTVYTEWSFALEELNRIVRRYPDCCNISFMSCEIEQLPLNI